MIERGVHSSNREPIEYHNAHIFAQYGAINQISYGSCLPQEYESITLEKSWTADSRAPSLSYDMPLET